MVTSYIIGNSDRFAIEFKVDPERPTNNLFGWLKLWFGGNYVGAYENICMPSITLHALEEFTKINLETSNFEKLSIDAIYCSIKSGELDEYWFAPGGDSFDDFSIVVYSHNGFYKFIWKIIENPFFEYNNYPDGFLSAEVNIEEFKRVIKDFKKLLDQLDKEISVCKKDRRPG